MTEVVDEDEMVNFCKVWALVIVSLSYCFFIGKITSKGFMRFMAILPIISLFVVLPLNLNSIHLSGFTSFFISWLANFKLLLFAFGELPLCSNPPVPFSRFLALACLPIKIQNSRKSRSPDQKMQNTSYPSPQHLKMRRWEKSFWNYAIKGVSIALFLRVYDYGEKIPQKILWMTYFLHIYLSLEIVLFILAKTTKFLLGLQVEAQFDEPLLSTSLQDFWGRRWNLIVTSILRPTVFYPVRNLTLRALGKSRATLVAVMAVFIVSSLMHELVFFHIGRVRPTFEVTRFFLLHGVLLCVEITVKDSPAQRWQVPRWVSGPATLAVLVITASRLFLPPLLRLGIGPKGVHEYEAAGVFVRRIGQALISKLVG